MFGWQGKILVIDLSKRKIETLKLKQEDYAAHVGGKGLAGYFLNDKVTLPWHDPQMPLLFFTGPLVDTLSPTSGRMTIMSRSPLTGTVCDTSVGGKLGTTLKRAGWDGIVISGKSSQLCGIEIIDSKVTLTDCPDLKGLRLSRIHTQLSRGQSYAAVGPAAENGVLFANICIDGHYFSGRGGIGLVMAEKKLKYITVNGNQKTRIYNRQKLLEAREEIFRLASASPILKGESGISNYGTGALFDLILSRRAMPTENFRKTFFAKGEKMNAWHYKQKFGFKSSGCMGCHILCKKSTQKNRPIPEYESMTHFSALINNTDLDLVITANSLCNDLGMDTISAAATLACYQEISEKGKFEASQLLDLIEDMAYSRNIGSQLKEGAYRFAAQKNRLHAAITVKKMELPAYDPRGTYGMGLAYVTSTRGGCHLRAYPISHEILRKPVVTDRFSFSGKARIIKLSEDLNAMIDSLTACKFLFFAATLEEYAKAFYGVTGLKINAQELLKIGEKIYYREKLMNYWNGFTSRDDQLPDRFFAEPGTSGDGIEVPPISKNDFIETRAKYYKIRGLDENGLPNQFKSEELGLKWKD